MSTVATRPPGLSGRTQADDFMRRLLRIDSEPNEATVKAAQNAMSRSIFISAVRCMLTYVIIPLGVPVLHILGTFGPAISIVLCATAIFFSTKSMRRFWAANHKYRWHYTIVAVTVMTYLTYGAVTDVIHLA